ncbi:S9 family peptidase [Chromobacterium sp. IIBBL 290-4]|uniref:alpha/beta hydrolase family protein n=1 Tax=Chromobacterium sp. IIBBL 290-4 TaxID=2953890 RepID=UPI0020B7088A|nr:alpha/beta hydrolase [Chromobacterium sp. IIBBL 290-4]UTH76350.1 alpha/beta hydrolase [Chromobacterium sp. IIBBL 290-4]
MEHAAATRDIAQPCLTASYGPDAAQAGDLYLPAQPHPAVVCLLHGGFWRMPYGREQMHAVAQDLVARGFAVWNLGYRRIGAPTGGWPNTGDDVLRGIEYLSSLAGKGIALDLDRIALVGHSAGGQLALWAAAQELNGIRVRAVAGEAPVSDLHAAYQLGLGRCSAQELLGATPDAQPKRYAAASPLHCLPLRIPQLVVHAIDDQAVPIDMSRAYAAAARAAGDAITLRELSDSDHMAFIDPASSAHAVVREWLSTALGVSEP